VRAVGDVLLQARGRAQVERQIDLAELGLAADIEAGAREDAKHRPVASHHVGVEADDPARGGDLGELLEHPRRQAAAVHLVGHREGDLGRDGLAQAVIARDGDDTPAEVCEEHDARVAVGVRIVVGDDVGPRDAVEAHVPALRRQRVVEGLLMSASSSGCGERSRRAAPSRRMTSRTSVVAAIRTGRTP
jgi:hypothetical protein